MVAVLASAGCAKRTQPQAAAPPSSEVFVANAIQEDVPIYSEWIGTTEGNVNAQIRPRVQGYLQLQHYDEGSFVQAGALLFPIDPVGEQVGSLWIIKGGLKPGERVVVAGLQKVQPGIKVVAKEAPAAPENAVASAASPGT